MRDDIDLPRRAGHEPSELECIDDRTYRERRVLEEDDIVILLLTAVQPH